MLRWLLPAALFVSLALNVFVLGAFMGAHLADIRARPAPASADPGPRSPLVTAVQTLRPEQRAAWRSRMPEFNQTYGARMRQARQRVRQTFRGFGDEPFDAQTRLAELKQARAIQQEGRAELDRQLVAFAATLPPADRARFGEALAQPALSRSGAGEADRRRSALEDR